MATARASEWDVLVGQNGATAVDTELLEGTLDATCGELESAIERLLANETADTLSRVLAPDGVLASLFFALREADAEANLMDEAAGVASISQGARGGICFSEAAKDGKTTSSSASATNTRGEVEPEREVSTAPVGGELQLIIGRWLEGGCGSTGIVFEFVRHCSINKKD